MDFGAFIIWGIVAWAVLILSVVSVIQGIKKSPNFWTTLKVTIGLIIFLILASLYIYKIYFLDENMAIEAASGQYEKVKYFLDRGASPNAYGVDCVHTALTGASEAGYLNVVKLLLERGADPNRCGGFSERKSAYRLALDNKHEDVAALLKEHGANPDYKCP